MGIGLVRHKDMTLCEPVMVNYETKATISNKEPGSNYANRLHQLIDLYMLTNNTNADAQTAKMVLINQVKELAFLGRHISLNCNKKLVTDRQIEGLWETFRGYRGYNYGWEFAPKHS